MADLNKGLQGLVSCELPPGQAGKAYTISSQDGEIIYIPLSKSATRLLVTGKESENAFAIVASGGSQSDPIGFHYHNEAHDVFLCLHGKVNVWANDRCRTLEAGDFASVPPGTVHQYQILGPHSEMIGLIVPGGWEEFFRFIGEPYAGPMWPMQDERNFFEVLLPRLKAATEKFDMIPCPQYKAVEPQPWSAEDAQLPKAAEPYFLRNATGPAFEVGGTVCRPLITTAQSHGKFAIAAIEQSSQYHEHSIFANDNRSLRFDAVHHAFLVTEGRVEFQVDDSRSSRLAPGDVMYVPKGSSFRFRTTSRLSKMYTFASGRGLGGLLCRLGESHVTTVLPEKARVWDSSELESLQSEYGFSLR